MSGKHWKFVTTVAVVALSLAASRAEQAQPNSPAFTMDGDIALWTMSIKPDKTGDFEKVMAKLRAALAKSTDQTRRQQLSGWKVMRVKKPLPDGNIAYVHIIDPVVLGADYTIMQVLYDEFPEERQTLYDLYRGAFASNLSLATGTVAFDMSGSASDRAPVP
jgi:hypothetical protein